MTGATAAFTRVTVLAPHRSVDVALPADVPVGELTPMVLELLGEPAPGARPQVWPLTGAGGGRLHPAATLTELGVLDGELLRIGPATAAPPPPVFDDPVDALAATAGAADGPRRGSAAVAAPVLAVAAAVVLATGDTWVWAGVALGVLGAAAALARAAVAVRAGVPERAAVAARVAVPLAAAVGAAAPVDPATRLLLAVAAAGTAAAVGQAVLRTVEPVLVGVVVAAVPTGVAAVLHLRLGWSPAALAAAVGALALVAGPLLPRVALRLAGLPRPVVPADADDLTGADDGPDVLPPAELAERAALARGQLAGLAGGCAVLAAAAVPLAALGGGWSGPALAAVIVAVLGLRSRGFADRAPARTLRGAALAGGLALAAVAALAGGPTARVAVAAVLVVGALGTLLAGPAAPDPSPVARRAVDVAENLLMALAVPLAVAATGLFALVRGL